jgi:hypothetical protein
MLEGTLRGKSVGPSLMCGGIAGEMEESYRKPNRLRADRARACASARGWQGDAPLPRWRRRLQGRAAVRGTCR